MPKCGSWMTPKTAKMSTSDSTTPPTLARCGATDRGRTRPVSVDAEARAKVA